MSVQCGDEQGSINEDRARGRRGGDRGVWRVWSRGQGGYGVGVGGCLKCQPCHNAACLVNSPALLRLFCPKIIHISFFSAIASLLLTQDSRGNSPEWHFHMSGVDKQPPNDQNHRGRIASIWTLWHTDHTIEGLFDHTNDCKPSFTLYSCVHWLKDCPSKLHDDSLINFAFCD